MLKIKNKSKKIKLIHGDITTIKVDAIVNAANSSLLGGGGVDGAIHRAGGPQILEECKKIKLGQGDCPAGEAVITTGGNLPSKFVIHTVGPVWYGGNNREVEKLQNAYKNSLILAIKNKIKTIAFPNISTGVYRFPKREAADIAISITREFINNNDSIDSVLFVCFDRENYEIYNTLINQ